MAAELAYGMCAASKGLPKMCSIQTEHAYESDVDADWTVSMSVKSKEQTWTENKESRAPGRMPCMPHA